MIILSSAAPYIHVQSSARIGIISKLTTRSRAFATFCELDWKFNLHVVQMLKQACAPLEMVSFKSWKKKH
jgi:hypothetical protein